MNSYHCYRALSIAVTTGGLPTPLFVLFKFLQYPQKYMNISLSLFLLQIEHNYHNKYMVYYQKMNHFTQVFTYHTVKKSPLNLTTRDIGIWYHRLTNHLIKKNNS